MTKYQIIASRGKGEQIVVSNKRPEKMDTDFRGYVYDRKYDELFSVGAEVFSRGYWQEETGTIELDDKGGV